MNTRRVLLSASAAAFAWAVVVYASGGLDTRLAGVPLRSRDPIRVAEVGAALLLAYMAAFRHAFAADVERLSDAVRRHAPLLAAAVALTSGIIALRYGAFSVGGADAYGYVSQAYDWAAGRLPHPIPLPVQFPWPSSDLIVTPLGYRPGPEPHTMVPTYAPGLPLLMAAMLVLGPLGPFLVTPACAVLATWFTYRLGRFAAGPIVGVSAAILMAASPIFQFQSVWAMSDVPSAALWGGATLASFGIRRRSAFAAGALTAAGLLVRPNLPLPAIVPLIAVLTVATLTARERAFRAGLFLLPVVTVVVAVAALNEIWFGSPLRSGYGSADEIYALASILPNLRQYPAWLWQSHSPLVLFAAVPLAFRRRPVTILYGIVLATFASYALYPPFDEWWYLRFLLPAWPAFMALIAAGIGLLASRRLRPWGAVVALLLIGGAIAWDVTFCRDRGIYLLGDSERRYIDAGQFAARELPSNAVVLTMQHSGTVRFYGGKLSIRYDFLDKERARQVPADLERLGYHPFLLIDDWETPYVNRQFGFPAESSLPWPVLGRMREFGGVTVFDLAASASPRPVTITPGALPLCPQPLPVVVRAGRS